MAGVGYMAKKYWYERARLLQWERLDKIEELPAHHFNNRGGVLIKKEFVGFEKYYRNDEALMNWYKKVYPSAFTVRHEEEATPANTSH